MSGARGHARRLRRVGAALGAGSLLASLVVLGAVPTAAPAAAAVDSPDYRQWKTLTREHVEASGAVTTVDTRTVTVTVDHTSDLRGRERVLVSWAGARPSAARAADPYGQKSMTTQEYPVVILQCRGLDDPNLPVAQQIQPETCWTNDVVKRYSAGVTAAAVWRHDRYASVADTAETDAATWPTVCGELQAPYFSKHLVPFRAANGTVYQSCTEKTMAPEAATEGDGVMPAAEIAAFTAADGTGEVQFEVRSDVENESLGCSDDVPCSLVVIPIMGISCADADAACRASGSFAPGSLNGLEDAVDLAVSAQFWWSQSNWRNRFSVPLDFATPVNVCDVLDPRAPVAMYGSDLLNQASLQWAPAYCLRADRFKYQHNRQPEVTALHLLETDQAVAALVSEPAKSSKVTLAYAPVAVSGFGVAYVSDLPDNAGELTTMRLTPRLIAKLLTQSYPASSIGQGREGLEKNPLTLNTDPEFLELNPTVKQNATEAMATVLSLTLPSDVMTAVTQYIAGDEEAMAFLAGEPDRWGMVVNPSYRDISVPRADWPLLDGFANPSSQACEKANPGPYLQRVASPVDSLRKIAVAVLDAWPNVTTWCDGNPVVGKPYVIKRIPRQSYGNRNMLGLVSLGDAERYGLRTAELRTSGTGTSATFVAASDDSMAAAVKVATQTAAGEPFTFDRGALPAAAYPGTMVVHATARLSGLEDADAETVADFIRIATTEGQTPGRSNGELPEGYLPIEKTGPTSRLFASAQKVAAAIEEQAGAMESKPTTAPTATKTTAPVVAAAPVAAAPLQSTTGLAAAASPVPQADVSTVTGLDAPAAAEVPTAVAAGTTVVQRSAVGQQAVAGSLLVTFAGTVGSSALWAWSTRRRLV